MTIFDALHLSRGWLAVAIVSDKSQAPVLDKTVSVEQFTYGVRLTATDSFALLTAWVPGLDTDAAEPLADEPPDAVAVAQDPYGRAKGFFSHLLGLASADGAEQIEVRLRLAVSPAAVDRGVMAFDGMDPLAVVIEQPDHERLILGTAEVEYPNWRKVVAGFHAAKTDAVALHPDRIGQLAKLGKVFDGPLLWRFGGRDRIALVEVADSEPRVTGAVMPVRWDFGRDAPAESVEREGREGA